VAFLWGGGEARATVCGEFGQEPGEVTAEQLLVSPASMGCKALAGIGASVFSGMVAIATAPLSRSGSR